MHKIRSYVDRKLPINLSRFNLMRASLEMTMVSDEHSGYLYPLRQCSSHIFGDHRHFIGLHPYCVNITIPDFKAIVDWKGQVYGYGALYAPKKIPITLLDHCRTYVRTHKASSL